ncbi:MAG: formate dehydrogenase subunit gamma [Beijerinckiaceae bacterium]|jgi:formate dehydrogenase subunit gamma
MPVYDAWDKGEAAAIVASLAHRDGAALPILHALLDRFGYVDKDIVPVIADALNLSRAEVHGTISFYHDFRSHPPGRHVIKLCRAEACQSRGSAALQAEIKDLLGVDWHGTSSDGAITLEPVFCLGLCANGPAALVDGEPEGNLDSVSLRAIVAEARA